LVHLLQPPKLLTLEACVTSSALITIEYADLLMKYNYKNALIINHSTVS
jgi:hypothetical protein